MASSVHHQGHNHEDLFKRMEKAFLQEQKRRKQEPPHSNPPKRDDYIHSIFTENVNTQTVKERKE